MRQANHDYYVREIEPAAHVQRVLDRVAAVVHRREVSP